MKIYSVYDRVTQVYGTPWYAHNHGDARRAFNNGYYKSPYADDMQLYYIGEFDEENGVILPTSKPDFVSNFERIVEVSNNE